MYSTMFSVCTDLSTCTRLWCEVEGVCLPTPGPPAPGSLCAPHRWSVNIFSIFTGCPNKHGN